MELVGVPALAARASAGEHQRAPAARMIERDLQSCIAAHRQAADVCAFNLEVIEHSDTIAHNVLVAVGPPVGRYVRRQVTTRGIGDATIALAEFTQLWLPAAMVASEFVQEQERRALPHLFVIEPHVVRRDSVRHSRLLRSILKRSYA